MRTGVSFALVSGNEEAFLDMQAYIRGLGHGFEIVSPGQAIARPAIDGAGAWLVDVGERAALDVGTMLVARGEQPVMALSRTASQTHLSAALAYGFDEFLGFPVDEPEFRALFERLGMLATIGAEAAVRAQILQRYRKTRTVVTPRRGPRVIPERPTILLVGPPGELQVNVAEAVGRAVIRYSDHLPKALPEGSVDLVLVTPGEGKIGAVPVFARQRAAMLLAGRSVDLEGARVAGFHDAIDATSSPMTLRLRLSFWLRFQRLRRAMRLSGADAERSMAVDQETGLYNRDFLCDYLTAVLEDAHGGPARAILCLALDGLDRLRRQKGGALVQRLVREASSAAASSCRVEDLVAYLGDGRIAILLEPLAPPAMSERIARRIAASLENVEALAAQGVRCGFATDRLQSGSDITRRLERLQREAAFRHNPA